MSKKSLGTENSLAKRTKEMTYPSIYDKHKYGGTDYAQYDFKSSKRPKNQKVVIKNSKTGRVCGSRVIAQRNVENVMTPKMSILDSAIQTLTDGAIPSQKIIVTRLAETVLVKESTLETPNVPSSGGASPTEPESIPSDISPDDTLDSPQDNAPESSATSELSRALRILSSVKKVIDNSRKKAERANDELMVLSHEQELDMIGSAIDAITTAMKSSEPPSEDQLPTTTPDPMADVGSIPHVAGYTATGKPIIEYTLATQSFQRKRRLQILKNKLDSGEMVEITDATYSRSPSGEEQFSWGDLQTLGYAERVFGQGSHRNLNRDEAWKFTGPPGSTITVVTQTATLDPGKPVAHGAASKVLRPGDTTDFINVDYS